MRIAFVVLILALPPLSLAGDLADDFASPPASARPRVLWQWVQFTPSDSLMWIIRPKLFSACLMVAGFPAGSAVVPATRIA